MGSTKDTLWIVIIIQNVFVSVEAIVLAILTFSTWDSVGYFSFIHFLFLSFTSVFFFNAVIGFCMRKNTCFIMTYVILNIIIRIIFFFFLVFAFYTYIFFYILNPSSATGLFLTVLFRYFRYYYDAISFWLWIQVPMIFEVSIVGCIYRGHVINDNSAVVVNIGMSSALYGQPVVAAPQYYQPVPVYQNAPMYNPPVQNV